MPFCRRRESVFAGSNNAGRERLQKRAVRQQLVVQLVQVQRRRRQFVERTHSEQHMLAGGRVTVLQREEIREQRQKTVRVDFVAPGTLGDGMW